MMMTKDDDKGDDKTLKDQSKNNSRESKTNKRGISFYGKIAN